jgi:hypothetical protein
MKEQKHLISGFILVEAATGVALFLMLMGGVLQGIGFIAQRVAVGAQRHKALCEIALHMHEDDAEQERNIVLPYTHPAVTWHCVMVSVGNETISVYGAQRKHGQA